MAGFEKIKIHLIMISVLIPIYNYEVIDLAKDLLVSCYKSNVSFEIIFVDDGSNVQYLRQNDPLNHMEGVQYIVLPKNIGRSAIRNFLTRTSKFDFLLFLDCDGKSLDEDFILNYLPYLLKDTVVSGGRIYPKLKVADCELHWTYGTYKESKSALDRNKVPYVNFHSNNFLVPRNIMLQFPFDESIVTYGFEDTLWANQLSKHNIKMLHIDNPIIHQGLEKNSVFLSKTKWAIENLVELNVKGIVLDTGIEKLYGILKKWGCHQFVGSILNNMQIQISKQLCSSHPRLFLFQLYKLGLYIQLRNSRR